MLPAKHSPEVTKERDDHGLVGVPRLARATVGIEDGEVLERVTCLGARRRGTAEEGQRAAARPGRDPREGRVASDATRAAQLIIGRAREESEYVPSAFSCKCLLKRSEAAPRHRKAPLHREPLIVSQLFLPRRLRQTPDKVVAQWRG